MEKIFEYLSANWPGTAIFVAGLAVIYVLFSRSAENMKLSVDALRTSNQDLREQLTTVKGQMGELDLQGKKRIEQMSAQVKALRATNASYQKDIRAVFDGLADLKAELDEMFQRFHDLRSAVSAAANEARHVARESLENQRRVEGLFLELMERAGQTTSSLHSRRRVRSFASLDEKTGAETNESPASYMPAPPFEDT